MTIEVQFGAFRKMFLIIFNLLTIILYQMKKTYLDNNKGIFWNKTYRTSNIINLFSETWIL